MLTANQSIKLPHAPSLMRTKPQWMIQRSSLQYPLLALNQLICTVINYMQFYNIPEGGIPFLAELCLSLHHNCNKIMLSSFNFAQIYQIYPIVKTCCLTEYTLSVASAKATFLPSFLDKTPSCPRKWTHYRVSYMMRETCVVIRASNTLKLKTHPNASLEVRKLN